MRRPGPCVRDLTGHSSSAVGAVCVHCRPVWQRLWLTQADPAIPAPRHLPRCLGKAEHGGNSPQLAETCSLTVALGEESESLNPGRSVSGRVFVSYCCCNKSHKRSGFATTQVHRHPVLEARAFLMGALGESPFLAFPGIQGPPVSFDWRPLPAMVAVRPLLCHRVPFPDSGPPARLLEGPWIIFSPPRSSRTISPTKDPQCNHVCSAPFAM